MSGEPRTVVTLSAGGMLVVAIALLGLTTSLLTYIAGFEDRVIIVLLVTYIVGLLAAVITK